MSIKDRKSDSIIRSLFERKSVRVFTGKNISEDDVRIIAEAAAQAPTAGNQQLYTILRITDPEKKHKLSISCDNQPFIEEADLVLVFGYPTEQQKERPKPKRLNLDYVLQENVYHEHTGEELRKMFENRTGRRTYDDWMRAFYERKYNSDFAREMTRSVRKFLEDFREVE